MSSSIVLIAESGSTKTDWAFLLPDNQIRAFKTTGINPHLQTAEGIGKILAEELPSDLSSPDRIVFYGAGISGETQEMMIRKALHKIFKKAEVAVHGDILAAARALCGNKKGIVSILGTGSNSCFYDGTAIREQQVSLGYLAGDEGSGSHMGKKILQYYAYGTFDEELRLAFEGLFGKSIETIIQRMYTKPFPNRYLASFVKLLTDNRGHFMVENIIEDCLHDFFHFHILKYRASWQHPLFFAGSVAWEFRDILQTLCRQYELDLGEILQSPMDGLISYHRS